uniref:Uncharacterized protein n=1 Tax=Peronospora matthiolae TaxID=2874970 RepID=A0AAV1U7L9_9STRA
MTTDLRRVLEALVQAESTESTQILEIRASSVLDEDFGVNVGATFDDEQRAYCGSKMNSH